VVARLDVLAIIPARGGSKSIPRKNIRVLKGLMQPIMDLGVPEPYNLPRQALPEIYWQTGYVDAVRTETIRTKHSMTGERILPLIIGADEWIDIDSPDDWRRAERLIESKEITLEDLGFKVQEV